MKWFSKFQPEGKDVMLQGPYLTQQDALDASAVCEANGAAIINAAFEADDDYQRTWKPVEVAVMTRDDGLYRIYSDGTESKIEE